MNSTFSNTLPSRWSLQLSAISSLKPTKNSPSLTQSISNNNQERYSNLSPLSKEKPRIKSSCDIMNDTKKESPNTNLFASSSVQFNKKVTARSLNTTQMRSSHFSPEKLTQRSERSTNISAINAQVSRGCTRAFEIYTNKKRAAHIKLAQIDERYENRQNQAKLNPSPKKSKQVLLQDNLVTESVLHSIKDNDNPNDSPLNRHKIPAESAFTMQEPSHRVYYWG